MRNRQLQGLKFRRQHVIKGIAVNFYCPACRLAVNVLPARMPTLQQWHQRLEREAVLEAAGYTVIRFMYTDIMWTLPVVLEIIAKTADECLSKRPLLSGERAVFEKNG